MSLLPEVKSHYGKLKSANYIVVMGSLYSWQNLGTKQCFLMGT